MSSQSGQNKVSLYYNPSGMDLGECIKQLKQFREDIADKHLVKVNAKDVALLRAMLEIVNYLEIPTKITEVGKS
tara:strand:+ start:1868 stop:2089 length:222 start_codon:yes stop_codon:yes gene_type:complete